MAIGAKNSNIFAKSLGFLCEREIEKYSVLIFAEFRANTGVERKCVKTYTNEMIPYNSVREKLRVEKWPGFHKTRMFRFPRELLSLEEG